MAHALLQAGHRVVLSSTDRESLEETARDAGAGKDRARIIVAELAIAGEPERLAAQAEACFGQVDILLNNAGMSVNNIRTDYLKNPFRFWESDRAQMERFFQVNTISSMILAATLAPKMIKRGWGRIVANTTSLDTMLRFSLYGGTKAALEAETAIMSSDLAGTGVTANVLVPGGGAGSRMTDMIGMPRDQVLPPEIMGPPMVFLASDEANDFNARRIIARKWDASLPAKEAAMAASDPIAWTGYGTQGFQPDMARLKPAPGK
jgi:3-oxoacyl-[acyl-carrier protein] reductase